jgi:hypothetical protein
MVRIPTHGPPTHPGTMLVEEFLKPLGMSQVELADRIGVSFPRVNELVHGKWGINPRYGAPARAVVRDGGPVLVEPAARVGPLPCRALPGRQVHPENSPTSPLTLLAPMPHRSPIPLLLVGLGIVVQTPPTPTDPSTEKKAWRFHGTVFWLGGAACKGIMCPRRMDR